MILNELFYHGSDTELPPGTILRPAAGYAEKWGDTDFYNVLEKYRPKSKLAHHDAVFMVDNEDDIDNAGGATDWVFIVEPSSRVERHDVGWSSEISTLVSNGIHHDDNQIKFAALKYWSGESFDDNPVWEYLTPKATIVKTYEY